MDNPKDKKNKKKAPNQQIKVPLSNKKTNVSSPEDLKKEIGLDAENPQTSSFSGGTGRGGNEGLDDD